jgi:SET domain-containing protein
MAVSDAALPPSPQPSRTFPQRRTKPWSIAESFIKSPAVPRRRHRIGRSNAGLGLFAIKPFKKGQYIVTYRGRRITNAQADELEAKGSRYMFEINNRWTIDGSSRWNIARYVNHSCRPNAVAVERRKRIVYIARRRIKPQEEITVDYGKDYFDAFIKSNGCRCAACKEKRSARRLKRKARARRRRPKRKR